MNGKISDDEPLNRSAYLHRGKTWREAELPIARLLTENRKLLGWLRSTHTSTCVRASERPRDRLVSTCLVPRFIYYRFDVSTSKGYRSTRRNPNSCRHSETRVFRRAIARRCLKKKKKKIRSVDYRSRRQHETILKRLSTPKRFDTIKNLPFAL